MTTSFPSCRMLLAALSTIAAGCVASRQPESAPSACPGPSYQSASTPGAAAPPSRSAVATSRTGVFVHRDITSACGVAQPKSYFEFDSSNLTSSELSGLESVATCLSTGRLKGKRVVITGRADPRGSEEHNKQLGMSRANSVGGFFSGKGVDASQIVTRSTGEASATGTDEDGWAYDRRVDIRLAK